MTARWLLTEGPLGNFQGIAALEIDGVRYSRETVEEIVKRTPLLEELFEDVQRWREDFDDVNLRYIIETAEKLELLAARDAGEEIDDGNSTTARGPEPGRHGRCL